jgi:hypothetical protein
MTDQELSEVIRVYHQYNMSFISFIKFAASRIGHCEDDHQLLEGVKILERDSYKITEGSTDITFCSSYCKNMECSRNTEGKVHKRAIIESPLNSYCDMSKHCRDFK